MSGTSHYKFRCAEFDSFAAIAKSFDWTPVQLSKGRLNLACELIDTGDFGVFYLSFDQRMQDRTVIRPGYVSFSLLMGNCAYENNPLARGTLAMLRDTRDYLTTFEQGFDCLEFYCRKELIGDHAIAPIALGRRWDEEQFLVDLTAEETKHLRRVLLGLLGDDSILLVPSVKGEALDAILTQLYQLIAPRVSPERPQQGLPPKRNLTSDALRLVDSMDSDVTIAGLTTELGVSRRALELSFGSSIGISPGQFLLARKLTHVRDALERDSGSVTEIAWREGFEHPSRFAFQYKRLFGELPSMTLNRARSLSQ